MIGPECVAQQKKLVTNRMMNCGDLSACASVMSGCGTAFTGAGVAAAPAPASAGGRRTNNETGIMMAAITPARINMVVRQSWVSTSQATNGDIVIGAMPMPAETSDTARLTWVVNQPVTV